MVTPKTDVSFLSDVKTISHSSFVNCKVTTENIIASPHSKTSSSEDVKPIWFCTKKLVSVFAHRDELDKILETFSTESNVPRLTVIAGLGGVGKSELALKFAFTYIHKFENFVWINSETKEELQKDFEKLASQLEITVNPAWQIKELVTRVYEKFEKKESLFIFDNVESWKSGSNPIFDYLPLGVRPNQALSVLMTSRYRTWGLPVKIIPLDILSTPQAVEYIKICLQLESVAEMNAAHNLTNVTDCLPLALQQAVAYIRCEIQNPPIDFNLTCENFKRSCIESFINRLETREAEILDYKDEEGHGDGYDKTVLLTWLVTFEKINECNPKAMEVMAMISYLRPDNIDLIMLSKSNHIDIQGLQKAIYILFQYSMIKRELNTVSVHRLVQKVVRFQNRKNKIEESTLSSLLEMFSKIINDNPFGCFSLYISSLSQAQFVWEHSLIYSNLVSSFQNYYLLLFDESDNCQLFHGNQKLLQKTLDKFGELDDFTIELKTRQVTTFLRIGMPTEAISLGEDLYALSSAARDEDDPLLIRLLCVISNAYGYKGDYQKALTICELLIKTYTNSPNFGPNHGDLQMSKFNMATLLRKLEKYEEALEICRSLLSIQLGRKTPGVMAVFRLETEIALLLHCQGKYQEALKSIENVYDKSKVMFGEEEHEFTHLIACAMAECLCDLKKWDEAKDVLQVKLKAVKIKPNNYLFKQHLLGRVLNANGRIDDAINVLRSALQDSANC